MVSLACGDVSTTATHLWCPLASNFEDKYHGLYGPTGAYPVTTPYCAEQVYSDILVSTLQFQCTQCPAGTYALQRGFSNGTAGGGNAFPCVPCPAGATCSDGAVVAAAGYWGASDGGVNVSSNASTTAAGTVSMIICPTGYCCDGDNWPCASVDACAGHRHGLLCGDCDDGYGASIGEIVMYGSVSFTQRFRCVATVVSLSTMTP